jgi:hypothetical protein
VSYVRREDAVSDEKRLIEMLSELESAIEDHSYALAAARKPSLTRDERLAIVRVSRESWKQLEAAWKALDQAAVQ